MQKNITTKIVAILLATLMVIGILPLDINAAGIPNSCPVEETNTYRPAEQYVPATQRIDTNRFRTFSEPNTLETQGEDSSNPDVWNQYRVETEEKPKIVPRSVDAEGKPAVDWDKDQGETAKTATEYWSLPRGVTAIHGQNGYDPLNTFGISYIGRYRDEKGNTVLKLDVGQTNTSVSSVWTHYVMRFPPKLYNSIDFSRSFITSKHTENYNADLVPFADVAFSGQGAFTKSFPYRSFNISYGHYEINLVLKDGTDWTKDFAKESQVIQLRLFDATGSRIFSTSSTSSNSKIAKYGYNTHTKVAVIADKVKRPTDLMESTTISRLQASLYDDIFWSTYSALQLDKDNKKVRIIYSPTKTDVTSSEYNVYDGENLAIRQTFDPEFIKYLKLKGKESVIGRFYILNPAEGEYKGFKPIEITANQINGVEKDESSLSLKLDENGLPIPNRTDGAAFIQLSTNAFRDRENEKIPANSGDKITTIKMNKGNGNNIFYDNATKDGYFLVFEYDIDPEKINSDLIASGKFIKNFMFDTRYITDNKVGVRKFTAKVPENISFIGSPKLFYRVRFKDNFKLTTRTDTVLKKYDFVLNVGGSEGIWKSWKREGYYRRTGDNGQYEYLIPLYGRGIPRYGEDDSLAIKAGAKIDKGTEVSVYLPKYTGYDGLLVRTVNDIDSESLDIDIVKADDNMDNLQPVVNLSKPGYNIEKVKLSKVHYTNAEGKMQDVFYFPMYIKNTVSTIGGSAVREQYAPIVNEIFTDSESFTGITRTEGGVFSQLNNTTKTDKGKYFGSNWMDLDVEYESLSDKQLEANIVPNILKMTFNSLDGKIKIGDVEQKQNKSTHVYEYSYNRNRELISIKLTNTEYNYNKETDKVESKTTTETFTGADAQKTADKLQAVKGKAYFNNKEYEGFKFDVENQYTGDNDYNKSNKTSNVQKLNLIKDQPIMFNTYKLTSLKSESVYEQVQAKVDFEVYPKTKTSNGLSLERIVPLNREYSIVPEIIKRNAAGVDITTKEERAKFGTVNETYEPNGFDWKERVNKKALDRNPIRVDEKNTTVDFKRPLAKEKLRGGFGEKTATYPNFINHDGFVYDINNEDVRISTRQRREFVKRLFPDPLYDEELIAEEPVKIDDSSSKPLTLRKDNAKVIGWTTKRIEGTVEEQSREFQKLKKAKKIIRRLEQWDLVDKDDNTEVFIFDKYSPVKDRRKVYAVWGNGIEITLHANRTVDSDGSKIEDDNLVQSLNLTQADLDNATKVDATGKEDEQGHYRLVEIPKAPYKASAKSIHAADEKLREFINGSRTTDSSKFNERYTFIGWTAFPEDELELRNSNVPEQTGTRSKISVESLLKPGDKKSIRFLTNGGSLIVPESIDELENFDLYAQYRPYFRVQLHKVVDHSARDPRPDGKAKGTYTLDEVDDITRPTVQIGLLHRTAVTEPEKPTVGPVSYFPLEKEEYGNDALKLYMNKDRSNPETPDIFDWYVPGYDENGERISYIGVEFPVKNDDKIGMKKSESENIEKYYKSNISWAELGITTVSLNRASMGRNGVAKTQTVNTSARRGGVIVADTYSGATSRVPIDNLNKTANTDMAQQWKDYKSAVDANKKYELVGYNILMTNTYTKKYNPIVDTIKHNDGKFTIKDTFKTDSKTDEILIAVQLKVKTDKNSKEKIYNFAYNNDKKEFYLLKDATWDLNNTVDYTSQNSFETDRTRANEILVDNSFITEQGRSLTFNLGNQKKFVYNANKTDNGYVTAKLFFGTALTSNESQEYVSPALSQAAKFVDQLKTTYKAPQGMSAEEFNALSDEEKKLKGDPDAYNFNAEITDYIFFPDEGSKYWVYKKSDINEEEVDGELVKTLAPGATKYGEYTMGANKISKFVMTMPWTEDIKSDTELVIVSQEPGGKSYGFSEAFTLDTVGPNVEQAVIQKSQWGFRYNIRAKIKEAVGKVYILDKNGYDESDPSAQKPEAKEFESSNDALEWLEYAWNKKDFDPKKLEIIAFDRYDNRIESNVKHNDLKYLAIRAEESFEGDDFVNVNIEKDTFLNIIVRDQDGDMLLNQTVFIDETIPHLEFKMINLLDKTGKPFALHEGYRIYYVGYQYVDGYDINSPEAKKYSPLSWENTGLIKAITRPFRLDVSGEW